MEHRGHIGYQMRSHGVEDYGIIAIRPQEASKFNYTHIRSICAQEEQCGCLFITIYCIYLPKEFRELRDFRDTKSVDNLR